MSDEQKQTDPLAGRDVIAEADQLLAAKRAEQARKWALAGATAALHRLEARARQGGDLLGRLARIEQKHAARVAEIDPGLRREVAELRRRELSREALGEGDALHRELLAEVEAARVEAERLADARRVRRRARFDSIDPMKDALVRMGWMMRLDSAPPDVLADWAQEAAQAGDLALLSAVEEALDARTGLDSGSPAERAAVKAIREAIDSYVPEQVARARTALEGVERAEREVRERLRLLRGGRPGGLHDIAEGVRSRRQQQAAG